MQTKKTIMQEVQELSEMAERLEQKLKDFSRGVGNIRVGDMVFGAHDDKTKDDMEDDMMVGADGISDR